MSKTITKHIGEGFASGELYNALAYDSSDKFGGYEIKSICLNWASYEDGDGRVCFYDETMYIAPWQETHLDIVAGDAIWIMSSDIYFYGDVHWAGEHSTTNTEFDVLLTNPTSAANALHGEIDAGLAWTSTDNLVGVRGKVDISTTGIAGDATGVWAGLDITGNFTRGGLVCGLNVEVQSAVAASPNAILYIQSLPKSGADFSAVPYIAFTELEGGQGSNLLFSLGHQPAGAGRNVTAGTTGDLYFEETIRIEANGSIRYIPLSTAVGTYTTAYPISVTVAGATAITIGTSAIGITMTGVYTTAALNISTTLAAYDDYAIKSVTTSAGTTATCEPNYFKATYTTEGAHGRAIYAELSTDVRLGQWSNAIKGKIDFNDAGSVAGLGSAICAEMEMGTATMSGVGSYGVMELELVCPQNWTGVQSLNFIWAQVSGDSTAVGIFEETGNLINIVGLSDADGNLYYHDTLRINVGGSKYIPLSTTQGSFTTIYPIVTTFATTAITIGTATTGLLVSGVFTNGISVISGSSTANQCGLRIADTVTATTGYHYGARINATFSAEGNCAVVGVLGELKMAAKLTGAACQSGVRGLLHFFTGTDIEGASSVISAVNAVMIDSGSAGAYTSGNICGLYIDNQMTADISAISGITAFIHMANNTATCTIDNVMYIHGPGVTYFANFNGCVFRDTTTPAAQTASGRIRIVVDGAVRYFYFYD